MTIEEAVKELMITDPFFGLLSIGINKIFSEEVPTACVAADPAQIKFVLHVNKKYWDTHLNNDQKIGLIQHEMLHIAEFHLFSLAEYEDKQLANIAMDMRINQYIPPERIHPLWISLDSFPPKVFPPRKTSREYYEMLKNEAKNGGNANLEGLLEADSQGKPTAAWHKLWDNKGEIPENLEYLYRKQIEHQMKDIFENYCDKNMGNIPGHLVGTIQKLYKRPKPITDWARAVRLFGSNSIEVMARSSRNKLNPRFPEDPAVKIRERKNLWVAIDTSGSMSNDILAKIWAQVDYIDRLGIEVIIIQADHSIQKMEKYNRHSRKIDVYGRGGTSFEEPIVKANSDPHCNGLIYCTDGYGSYQTPPRKPLLWIVTPCGTRSFSPKHGRVIFMER